MAKEIERKFLVKHVPFDLTELTAKYILQGYFSREDNAQVDVASHRNAATILTVCYGAGKVFSHVIPRLDGCALLENYGTALSAGQDWQRGVLSSGDSAPTVRVRLQNGVGFMTIKGKPFRGGLSRDEFEYEIPLDDAKRMFDQYCRELRVEKVRYCIPYGELTIELDIFQGALKGLVLAEVELPTEDTELTVPAWFGAEVTHDKAYTNVSLAQKARESACDEG